MSLLRVRKSVISPVNIIHFKHEVVYPLLTMFIICTNNWFYTYLSDGQRILSCGADHFMRVLDVHTGTEVYSKDVGEEIRCVEHV